MPCTAPTESPLGQEGHRVKLLGWLYISAQSGVLRMVAASASTACQPVHGSVGPLSVNWSHFPTRFPSTDIWLRPCWGLWPSFLHDQEVGSVACSVWVCPTPYRILCTPPPSPKKGFSVPFSAPDTHRPPSQNPWALGRNDLLRALFTPSL